MSVNTFDYPRHLQLTQEFTSSRCDPKTAREAKGATFFNRPPEPPKRYVFQPAFIEELDETDWDKSATHPRLGQPMRIVDIVYFFSEHDDYHLARIGELIRNFAQSG